jgi:hypothetical protein
MSLERDGVTTEAADDGARPRPLSARDAKAVLMEQLLGDVDQLLARVERVAPELDAAASRLERATQASLASFQTGAEAAKTSVGEWIVRTTNDATAKAIAEHRAAIAEAVAAELGRGLLAAQDRAQANARMNTAAAPVRSAVNPWLAVGLVAAGAVVALLVRQLFAVVGT